MTGPPATRASLQRPCAFAPWLKDAAVAIDCAADGEHCGGKKGKRFFPPWPDMGLACSAVERFHCRRSFLTLPWPGWLRIRRMFMLHHYWETLGPKRAGALHAIVWS